MPAGDVAQGLKAGASFLPDNGAGRVSSTEAKSGGLFLMVPGKHPEAVQVKVYRTSLEHFALVYPQKKVCRPLGFVNLRHTVVARLPSPGEKVLVKGAARAQTKLRQTHAASGCLPRQYQHLAGFEVRSLQCDAPNTLTFLCESLKELELWLAAFDPTRSARTVGALRTQPILEEGDEQ